MSGKEWRSDIIPACIQELGEIPESLRGVPATMKQQNAWRAHTVAQLERFCAGDDSVAADGEPSQEFVAAPKCRAARLPYGRKHANQHE